MKILKGYSPHSVALITLTILGEAVMTVPYKPSDIYSFSGFLSAFVLSIALFLLAPFLFKSGIKTLKNSSLAVKIICRGVFLLLSLLFCLSSAFPFLEFLNFSEKILMPRASKIIVILLFLSVLIPFLTAKKEAVFKFALISAVFSAIIIFLLFIVSVPSMKLINISVFSFPPIKNLTKEGTSYFLKIFLPALASIGLCHKANPSFNKKTALLGVASGGILLSGVFLTSLLILGSGVNHFEFPYLSAIGTLTFGNLFTRLDLFVYFLFFVSALIKTAVLIRSGVFIIRLLKTEKSP